MWRDYDMYKENIKDMSIKDAVKYLYYKAEESKYHISKILNISEWQVDKILGYV